MAQDKLQINGQEVTLDGASTSEYERTKSSALWSNIVTILGGVLAFAPSVIGVLPQDSKWFIIGGSALAIISQIKRMIVDLGYTQSRQAVKTAALSAASQK